MPAGTLYLFRPRAVAHVEHLTAGAGPAAKGQLQTLGRCERNGDSYPLYPCPSAAKPLTLHASHKINPTDLHRAHTGLALTREDFEELRTFGM
jgi:hypothetical protein